MEVLVKYEKGFGFSAACKGYTFTTGRGEDGKRERDGMWPVQLRPVNYFKAEILPCVFMLLNKN